MESNRICFIKVIENLQCLARQGQAMQGDTDDESIFIQLLQKDQPFLLKWLERKEDRNIIAFSFTLENAILRKQC